MKNPFKEKNILKTCNGCVFYYITHIQQRPYGCKKFGFLSKNLPYLEVKQSSGTECAYYTQKRISQLSRGKNVRKRSADSSRSN